MPSERIEPLNDSRCPRCGAPTIRTAKYLLCGRVWTCPWNMTLDDGAEYFRQ